MVKLTKRNMNKKNKKSVKRRSKKAGNNDITKYPKQQDLNNNKEPNSYTPKEGFKASRLLGDITGIHTDAGKLKKMLKDFKESGNTSNLKNDWDNSGFEYKYLDKQRLEVSEDTIRLLNYLRTEHKKDNTIRNIYYMVTPKIGRRKRKHILEDIQNIWWKIPNDEVRKDNTKDLMIEFNNSSGPILTRQYDHFKENKSKGIRVRINEADETAQKARDEFEKNVEDVEKTDDMSTELHQFGGKRKRKSKKSRKSRRTRRR